MGYSTHPGLVTENAELLSEIRDTLERGENLLLTIKGNVSSEQYRLNRILAACERHPEALRGEFVGLRAKASITVEGTNLLIKLKGGIVNFSRAKRSLEGEIRRIKAYPGNMDQVSFHPLPSDGDISEHFSQIGWHVHLNTRTEDTDGEVSYLVERIKEGESEKGGFNRFG